MSDAAQPSAAEVRAAAEALKTALDRHLEAVERRSAEGVTAAEAARADAAVHAAFDELAAAGEAYDELLYDVYDEVTPFEVPGGDTMPTYTGPEEPAALTVLIRRDYTVVEPQRLMAQAQRVTELDPDSADTDTEALEGPFAGSGAHAALGVLFGEYEPDEIATRHKEFGLEEGDSTMWVIASEEPAEPGEWLSAPFESADAERVVCRFDVSAVFDEEDFYGGRADADPDDAEDVADAGEEAGDGDDEALEELEDPEEFDAETGADDAGLGDTTRRGRA
ncbi:hypothetical protein CUT44_24915 [Streptomyces carminius]|uniref:Uncharacterized protein n=1 Tax=Streptomyces carminius TaxID=2665496 RepID=A0A2M8LSH7_9ACTN|nr:hypothetical protein [Streptomyces carminius]PJE94922.1 hypothetical protein CUT44_24915 [Streptomyces carminius]